jgi:hypothetical protein
VSGIAPVGSEALVAIAPLPLAVAVANEVFVDFPPLPCRYQRFQYKVSGIAPVDNGELAGTQLGVENVNLSHLVEKHTDYQVIAVACAALFAHIYAPLTYRIPSFAPHHNTTQHNTTHTTLYTPLLHLTITPRHTSQARMQDILACLIAHVCTIKHT